MKKDKYQGDRTSIGDGAYARVDGFLMESRTLVCSAKVGGWTVWPDDNIRSILYPRRETWLGSGLKSREFSVSHSAPNSAFGWSPVDH